MEATVKRSTSRTYPSSRPTTPLRPSSRTSLRESSVANGNSSSEFPLDALEPAFAELADSMADLEANFMHLQLMHESLSRFNENFASFLYGLNMNAFCVDFPEAPIAESFKRSRENDERTASTNFPELHRNDFDAENTFMTTDTSFVDNPPTVSRATSKSGTPASTTRSSSGIARGGAKSGRGELTRGGGRSRGSGLARAKPRGSR
ncbi:DASH complex subunit dam1 [Varicellaria rhodocarpa]|nr:DASH complex subunit dam1 [Varicellaria rhodocarpa]